LNVQTPSVGKDYELEEPFTEEEIAIRLLTSEVSSQELRHYLHMSWDLGVTPDQVRYKHTNIFLEGIDPMAKELVDMVIETMPKVHPTKFSNLSQGDLVSEFLRQAAQAWLYANCKPLVHAEKLMDIAGERTERNYDLKMG
jgi:hypothetical protein